MLLETTLFGRIWLGLAVFNYLDSFSVTLWQTSLLPCHVARVQGSLNLASIINMFKGRLKDIKMQFVPAVQWDGVEEPVGGDLLWGFVEPRQRRSPQCPKCSKPLADQAKQLEC